MDTPESDDPVVSTEEKVQFADLLTGVMLRCGGVVTITLNEHLLYGDMRSALAHAKDASRVPLSPRQADHIQQYGTVAEVVGWVDGKHKLQIVRASLVDALAAFMCASEDPQL